MVQPIYMMLPCIKSNVSHTKNKEYGEKAKNIIVVDDRPSFFVSTKLCREVAS